MSERRDPDNPPTEAETPPNELKDARSDGDETPARGDESAADAGSGGTGADRRAADSDLGGGVASADSGAGGGPGLVARVRERLTRTESWSPPAAGERRLGAVRRYLSADDAVRGAERVRVVSATDADGTEQEGGPAVAGRSREALLLVTGAGSFQVAFDGVERVERSFGSARSLRWRDPRLVGAVGYLCSVLAFLAVMTVAVTPMAPALAMAAGIGALLHTHVRSSGVTVRGRTVTDRLGAVPPLGSVAAALGRFERRAFGEAGPDPFARWTTATVVFAPLAATIALEPGWVAPLLTALTVASFAAVAAAVSYRGAFERLGVVRRRYKTVTVTLADGSSVVIRTAPSSTLDRDLATGAPDRSLAPASDRSSTASSD